MDSTVVGGGLQEPEDPEMMPGILNSGFGRRLWVDLMGSNQDGSYYLIASPTPCPFLLPYLIPKDSPPLKQLLLQLFWAGLELDIMGQPTSKIRHQDPHIQAIDSGSSCSTTCPVICGGGGC